MKTKGTNLQNLVRYFIVAERKYVLKWLFSPFEFSEPPNQSLLSRHSGLIISIMSPVTHFLGAWMVANSANLGKRDRCLVTVAGIIPDADAAGVIVDLVAPKPGQPWFWFSELHHLLGHNLPFCLLCLVLVGCFANRRWLTVGLGAVSFHLHLFCDLIGARGPDGCHWPMPYFWPLSDTWVWDWSGQWAFNGWQNIVITLVLLAATLFLAWKRGFSPLEMISQKVDRTLINAIHLRFGEPTRLQETT